MPVVSVIIPVYNVQAYLKNCLDSLTAQTFTDWEAICVDDGSTDDCPKILKQYAQKDSRFKIITQQNQGLSVARNTGFPHIRGSYVYFLDSDDAMHPKLLEYAYRRACQHNADVVCFGFEKKWGTNDISTTTDNLPELSKIKYKIPKNPLAYWMRKGKCRITYNVWSKLYKKETIAGINFIPKIAFEDFPFVGAVLSKNPKTVILKAKLYYSTYNPNSMSHQKETPERIENYHTGIKCLYPFLNASQLKIIKRIFIPNILKQQLSKVQNCDTSSAIDMQRAFAEELVDLNEKGLIGLRGHKIKRYFLYKRFIKQYQRENQNAV